jgi:uncharacterized protein YndB with AHSA1/START domain
MPTPDRVEKEIRVAASPEQVWAVLTERASIDAWLSIGFTVRELDLRPGGLLLLDQPSKHATLRARVVTVDPPHVFAYRWAMAHPGAEPDAGNSTLVEFRLTREGEGTLLRVQESGFANWALPEGREYAGAEAHSRGWPLFLAEIRRIAEEHAGA